MNAPINRLLFEQNLRGQLIRFALTGGLLTVGAALLYWLLAKFYDVLPLLAMSIAYGIVTVIGFFLHSRFSFDGHGYRDQLAWRSSRYFLTCAAGYFSNQFFVWLLTEKMSGPIWWPIIPLVTVTPILTFLLNRNWVFK